MLVQNSAVARTWLNLGGQLKSTRLRRATRRRARLHRVNKQPAAWGARQHLVSARSWPARHVAGHSARRPARWPTDADRLGAGSPLRSGWPGPRWLVAQRDANARRRSAAHSDSPTAVSTWPASGGQPARSLAVLGQTRPQSHSQCQLLALAIASPSCCRRRRRPARARPGRQHVARTDLIAAAQR